MAETTTAAAARSCKHCHRTSNGSDDVARSLGWRWYDGPTIGGGRLVDVVCPICAGTAKPDVVAADVKAESWNVGCRTCDWDDSEDSEPGDEPLTLVQAIAVAHDHRCEPNMWMRGPADSTEYDPDDFDHAGRLWPSSATRYPNAAAAGIQIRPSEVA